MGDSAHSQGSTGMENPPDSPPSESTPVAGSASTSDFAFASAEGFAELGRIVLAEEPLDAILARVAELANRLIPGAAQTSVTLINDGDAKTAAYTGELALQLDLKQYEFDHGPCLEAARDGVEVLVNDASLETRWPQYIPAALAAGAYSSLSMPLPVQRQVIGALNIYGTEVGAFTEHSAELARTFAGYAAVALANAQVFAATTTLAAQMQQAMESRAVIEQAKGILMGQRRCGPDEAFLILRDLSQRSNRKLRVVAETLVAEAQKPAR
jgi:transcriptional regulator with GAF, ATPase, and Fis domain